MDHHISTMLCLSTAHVRPGTMARIERGEFEWLPTFRKSFGYDTYGAFVACDVDLSEGSDETRDIPDDLLAVLLYADAFKVDWIMFDADEDEIGELLSYRDEWAASAMKMIIS